MKVNNGSAVVTAGAPRTRRTQAQRTAATRSRLTEAGRKLFADKGFTAVTTQEIVAAAGLTRGALYHQFDSKAALFAAVYEEVEHDLVTEVADQILAAQPRDQLDAMRTGARVFLQRCAAPEVVRIVLIDAPTVLGWDHWRAVGIKYGLGVIEGTLTQAIADGAVPEQPVRPCAHVLLAALDEAALYISRATDPDRAREEMYAVCNRLISGIAERGT
ncbi:TetR/AcrR family transcriptional regulator [Mycobacterium decipiens]|uniref:TetR family transcriptional regulator n=1 Tax=Mycobacterium decipiens TaxID=1430326 RepID=A0A1X2LSK6_9MYCO|nr:TetR/AcrR family transcriptional regulator [Mycobacterium decipiens]OSC39753.1 TetR family transcriptional regulator [Mycobacterium decipiens]